MMSCARTGTLTTEAGLIEPLKAGQQVDVVPSRAASCVQSGLLPTQTWTI